jgi:hypothetical protein
MPPSGTFSEALPQAPKGGEAQNLWMGTNPVDGGCGQFSAEKVAENRLYAPSIHRLGGAARHFSLASYVPT